MSRETLDIVQWVLTLVSLFCACMAVYSAKQAIKYAECARQWADSALLVSVPTFKASSRFSRPSDLWKVL